MIIIIQKYLVSTYILRSVVGLHFRKYPYTFLYMPVINTLPEEHQKIIILVFPYLIM